MSFCYNLRSLLLEGPMFIRVLLVLGLALSTAVNAAETSPFQIIQSDEGLRLRLGESLHFKSGSPSLEDDAAPLLKQVSAYIKGQKFSRLRVEGHTDSTGFSKNSKSDINNNWVLSAARAGSVVDALAQDGLSAAKMYAVGMGSTKPLANNSSAAGRAKNRRIEIVLEPLPVAQPDPKAAILERLSKARPDLSFGEVTKTAVPDLYQVDFNQGGMIYSTATGEFFVVGEIYQVGDKGIVNLTEKAREGERRKLIASIDAKDTISFSPAGKPKAQIFVFTDVDCPYCRLLHKEVPKLNDMGIEVSYLAYPRQGPDSPVATKMVSAWCSKDRKAAFNTLKAGGDLPVITCPNPVAQEFELGQKVGVNGTPAILLTNGELIPGYMNAEQLASRLGIK